ncbi:MAG: right-handed parallel beta-helix repeat-containing protein [Actinomycetota bacterium]|nr:right-handed parallel beta-helix repeat-containing protein [Actinomycetota bacterium]
MSATVLALAGLTLTAGPAQATHVACGTVITQNTTLDSDIGPCPGDGLIVTASNVTVDLNGFRIFAANGPGDNAGIRLMNPSTGGVSGVTVKNGTVEGFDAGVVIQGGSGNTVQNMTVRNNVNDYLGRPCDLGDGIAILNSDDNRILDNRILNNGPYGGISLIEDSDRNLIRGNVVLGHNLRSLPGSGCGNTNQDEGIRVEGPGANDNIVENNRVEGSGLAGIGLHGHVCNPGPNEDATDPNTGTIVRRNTVQNNEGDGISFLQQGPASIVCPSFGNTIERNISSNNGGDGIFVAHNSHDNNISHNVVSNNAFAGIRLNDPTYSNEFTRTGPSTLDLVMPDQPPYVECTTAPCPPGTDYVALSGSGSGDVTGRLVAIGPISVPPGGFDTSTSGCSLSDFAAAGFMPGDIALIQRGSCSRTQKIQNAVLSGASAVVFFNEGTAGRTGVLTAGVDPVAIPVVGTSYAVGEELYNLTLAGPVTIRVATSTTNVQTVAAPAPYNNILIGNRGSGNAEVDGYDGNLEPPCDNNKWRASRFVTVNQPCVVGPGGSGNAKGRTGERPGNRGHGKDVGTARGKSAGSRLDI